MKGLAETHADVAPPPGHYVVVGASGLMGSHALRALAGRQGITVTAVRNRRALSHHADNIAVVQADVTDARQCDELFRGADHVLLFAGILATAPILANDPIRPVLDSLRITVNCLEAAHRAGVGRLVWLSSTTGYPPLEGELREEQMFQGDPPDSWYSLGWAFRYLETLCRSFAERFPRPMTVTALRPTLIFGEYDNFDDDTAHFLPAMIRRVVKRERPIEVWGDGSQTRDLVYAGDVVDAALRALRRESGFDAVNIAAGHSYSVIETLEKIIAIDGFADADIIFRRDRPSSIFHRSFSGTRALANYGFSPRTSLEEGLKRTITWYRAQSVGCETPSHSALLQR